MDHSIALNLPPLRKRILRSFLVMVLLYGALTVFIMVAVFFASGITPQLLHVNYDSIAAASKMHEAWDSLRHPDDDSAHDAQHWTRQFEAALKFEEGNVTEAGEGAATKRIREIWNGVSSNPQKIQSDDFTASYRQLNQNLAQIVLVNERGMFTLADKSVELRLRVFIVSGAIFIAALLLAIYLSDGLANRTASPLKEIAEALRNKPTPGGKLRLPTPTSLEMRILTHEMNQLWKRLSEFKVLNVEELAMQRSKLEIVVESVEDAILVLDSFGNVLQSNQGLAEILGLPAASINGQRWSDLPTGNQNYIKLRDLFIPEMQPNNSVEVELRGETHVFSGRKREIIGKKGESLGSLFLLHDVTDRKQRDRLKAEFIAVLSHELKTPLQSLGTASELLLKRKTRMDEESQMLVDTVHEDVERIRAVAQDFIQVSFVDPHTLKLRLANHPLSELVQEWVKPFKLVAKDKGVSVDILREGSNLIYANIDSVKFPWAISNLLSNAIRFSPPESKVTVYLSDQGEQIRIEIRDEGPGIPEGMRKKMFDPYFQVPNTESKFPNGFLGLGLTIAKEVVEAHQGHIEYVPGNPRGSIFRINLPLVQLVG